MHVSLDPMLEQYYRNYPVVSATEWRPPVENVSRVTAGGSNFTTPPHRGRVALREFGLGAAGKIRLGAGVSILWGDPVGEGGGRKQQSGSQGLLVRQ
jgi:hypothetical protein